jgi:hypothetical protein
MLVLRTLLPAIAIAGIGLGFGQDGTAPGISLPAPAVIKGAPFAAQAVTESIQTLADGNRVVRKMVSSIARDAEGRTRQEKTGVAGAPAVVIIHDPVAGAAYMLDGKSRSAMRLPVAEPESGVRPGAPAIGSEPLGDLMVEGLLAHGSRLTRSIPAGQAGNEREVQIVFEAWYSDELQTVLLTRTQDPRFGETTYKLTEIQRGEQPKSLFEVPQAYRVVDTEGRKR